jgi:hypothetical protein
VEHAVKVESLALIYPCVLVDEESEVVIWVLDGADLVLFVDKVTASVRW